MHYTLSVIINIDSQHYMLLRKLKTLAKKQIEWDKRHKYVKKYYHVT